MRDASSLLRFVPVLDSLAEKNGDRLLVPMDSRCTAAPTGDSDYAFHRRGGVVVEGDGQKVGLLVDDLLAQQQVVIKSLESNYKRVEGISGATILGDGSVSMILDIPGLIASASRRSRKIRGSRAA